MTAAGVVGSPAARPGRAGAALALFGAALLLLQAAPRARAADPAPDEPVDARLAEVEGDVLVFHAEEPEEPVAAEADMILDAGDRIQTGEGARAELALEGSAVIELGPHSDFTITSVERQAPVLTLTLGRLVAKLQSFFSPGGRLLVKTPHAVAAVRGTEFGVEIADEEDETLVAVFDEGKVGVSGTGGGEETVLEAGHETGVREGGPPSKAERLRRFARHRNRMKRLRARHAAIAKGWRRLPPGERKALRAKLRERAKGLPPEKREKLRQRARRVHELREKRRGRLRERLEKNQKGGGPRRGPRRRGRPEGRPGGPR